MNNDYVKTIVFLLTELPESGEESFRKIRFSSRDMTDDAPCTVSLQYYPFILHRDTLEYVCQDSERKWTAKPRAGERRITFKSKKTGCRSKMVVKEISLFGDVHVTNPGIKRARDKASKKARNQLSSVDPGKRVIKRYHIRINMKHNTHPRHQYVGVNNPIHPDRARQIQAMARKGIRSVATAKLCLGYITSTKSLGNRLNPTSRSIVNHLNIGAKQMRSSENDQLDLLIQVFAKCPRNICIITAVFKTAVYSFSKLTRVCSQNSVILHFRLRGGNSTSLTIL